jgi:hypothetical protein
MRKCTALLWLFLTPVSVNANTVEAVLPDAELRGAATFHFVGFSLYTARLFTLSGAPLDWNEDFGLELQYKRNLSELDLMEGTMREFARLGDPVPVRSQLQTCFDDVRKGDLFTAVSKGLSCPNRAKDVCPSTQYD